MALLQFATVFAYVTQIYFNKTSDAIWEEYCGVQTSLKKICMYMFRQSLLIQTLFDSVSKLLAHTR